MSKFIKLSSVVLNTRFIQKILIRENAYEIHIKNLEKSCTVLVGSGGYNHEPEIWTIPTKGSDHDTLTKFINSYSFK
jgi:hypothetical protein